MLCCVLPSPKSQSNAGAVQMAGGLTICRALKLARALSPILLVPPAPAFAAAARGAAAVASSPGSESSSSKKISYPPSVGSSQPPPVQILHSVPCDTGGPLPGQRWQDPAGPGPQPPAGRGGGGGAPPQPATRDPLH